MVGQSIGCVGIPPWMCGLLEPFFYGISLVLLQHNLTSRTGEYGRYDMLEERLSS